MITNLKFKSQKYLIILYLNQRDTINITYFVNDKLYNRVGICSVPVLLLFVKIQCKMEIQKLIDNKYKKAIVTSNLTIMLK